VNLEKRAQQVEKTALKAAQKAVHRHPGQPLSRDELLQLRIQSVPTWKRVVLVCLGVGLFVLGALLVPDPSTAGGVSLCVIGLAILLIGILGRRRTVESCLNELGSGLADGVVEAVLNALDGF
jgi:uncharacterized membrane protein HdeD (DUF308 family)